MTGTSYTISAPSISISHGFWRYWLLRDEDDLMGKDEPVANTASDYFAQLATWLDEVCMNLGGQNRQEIAKLQRIVDDLLYLYNHYEIKKKS